MRDDHDLTQKKSLSPERQFIEQERRLDFFKPDDASSNPLPAALKPEKSKNVEILSHKRRAISLMAKAASQTQKLIEEEADRGTGFVLIPVFLGAGILFYHGLSFEPALQPIFFALVVLSVLAFVLRQHRLVMMLFIASILSIGGLTLAKIETERHATKMLGSEVTTRLTGRIVKAEPSDRGRARLWIDIISTERPKLRHAPDRVRITARGDWSKFEPGLQVKALVRLFPIAGPLRPGGYDFSREAYFDGFGANGFAMGKVSIIPEKHVSTHLRSLGDVIESLRLKLTTRVYRAIEGSIGNANAAVAAALVTGVRGGVPDDVAEALRRSGLAHILAISGLHMGLIAMTMMVTLRALFALFPAWSDRWPAKKIAAAAGFLTATCYLLISGGSVATIRSYIMLSVILLAILAGREALTIRNVAIAAIIILVLYPHEIAGPGFQMSFAATAALIASYRIWAQWRSTAKQFVPNHGLIDQLRARFGGFFGGIILSSVVAGLATLPFAAYHFERVAPYSLLANLLAMPLMSLMVMPAALLGAITIPFDLDGPIWRLMGVGNGWVIESAKYTASLPGPDAVGILPFGFAISATFAIVTLTAFQTRIRYIALGLMLIAGLFVMKPRPILVATIAENAGLVAVKWGVGQSLAFDKMRPNGFLSDNLMRTFIANDRLKPVSHADMSLNTLSKLTQSTSNKNENGAFQCNEDVCLIALPDGKLLGVAETMEAAKTLCKVVNVLIIREASKLKACKAKEAMTVTAVRLARLGAAQIFINKQRDDDEKQSEFQVRHTLASLDRPWHQSRQFS